MMRASLDNYDYYILLVKQKTGRLTEPCCLELIRLNVSLSCLVFKLLPKLVSFYHFKVESILCKRKL